MKIAIDARLYRQTGVGRYIRNLIRELSAIDDRNKYIVYLRKNEYREFTIPNLRWEKKLLDVTWHTVKEQLLVPVRLLADRTDIVHFPYFNIPIFYPGKYVVTIHDLIVNHFDTGRASTLHPMLYYLKRIGYHVTHQIGIKRASEITVISETTKREVEDHYGVSAQKMTTTYDALDGNFRKIANTGLKRKKRFQSPYILYVGNAYPHKNVEGLLHALSYLVTFQHIKLVLAGDDSYFYPRLKRLTKELGIKDSVVFFGDANDDDLVDLYSFASCLVYPSFMEGFGLPNLEALACGCLPVVSNIAVFNEIWGKLLPMFDPKDSIDMAKRISDVLSMSHSQYKSRVTAAQKRIYDFSWRKTAEKTLQVYESVYSR